MESSSSGIGRPAAVATPTGPDWPEGPGWNLEPHCWVRVRVCRLFIHSGPLGSSDQHLVHTGPSSRPVQGGCGSVLRRPAAPERHTAAALILLRRKETITLLSRGSVLGSARSKNTHLGCRVGGGEFTCTTTACTAASLQPPGGVGGIPSGISFAFSLEFF